MLRTSLALATLICALLLTALAPSGVRDEPDFGALGQTLACSGVNKVGIAEVK